MSDSTEELGLLYDETGFVELKAEDITADMIYDEIVGVNEEGFTRSGVLLLLENFHHYFQNNGEVEFPEDDREYIRESRPVYCKVDSHSLVNDIISLIFTFETVESMEMEEMEEILELYVSMFKESSEALKESGLADIGGEALSNSNLSVPVLSINFMPYAFAGKGVASFVRPITYFKTLNKENKKVCLHLLFKSDDVAYNSVDISDEELTEIVTDYLREQDIKDSTEYNDTRFV